MAWTTRPSQHGDIPGIVRLLERALNEEGLTSSLAELVVDLRAESSNIVAVVGDVIVGTLLSRCEGDVGRILAIAIAPEWRNQGVGSELLQAAESALLKQGASKIVALLADGQVGSTALINRGFDPTPNLVLYQKDEPLLPTEFTILEAWGGELIAPSRWADFSGLRMQRDIVEDRVLAPLLQADLAGQFGVVPPAAMLLFGPPGTGKTSFAKAVAGRLGWPFVELLPSKLGAQGAAMMAEELHRAFDELLALEHVVVFIDEVDDIASSRAARPETQAVVNELLKAIMRVRDVPGRLLVCATNSIAALDPAVVRPGRFDLVVPIGPPDSEARLALLTSMLGTVPANTAVPAELVMSTAGLTPADIATAVQRAGSAAFTAARNGKPQTTLTTDAVLAAVESTIPTISADDLATFDAEVDRYSRI
jgi:transitional endoplasmic reticulum ATPase